MSRAILVGAAKRALQEQGYNIKRIPGHRRSNMWDAEKDGKAERVSIRTTRNRWIVFEPLEGGTKWQTLNDVDTVVVAAVDDRDDPSSVEVYQFEADQVRKRFDDAYAARIEAGRTMRDNLGMWVNLDEGNRGNLTSAGSGLAAEHDPIEQYPLSELIESADPAKAAQEAAADEAE